MNYSSILGMAMAVTGMLKEIILALAMGVFVIVLTIKDNKINRKLAIGLLTLFYVVPMLSWYFMMAGMKDKAQAQEFGIGYIGMLIIMLFLQTYIGYFIGELIFKKKIQNQNRKDDEQQAHPADPE